MLFPKLKNGSSLAVVSAFVLFATFALSASAATIARWTPAHASTVARGKCVGVSKGVSGKYAAFKCAKGGVVFAKVRPDGRILCYSRLSLVAISKACMTVPGMG